MDSKSNKIITKRLWHDAARVFANADKDERHYLVVVEIYKDGTWTAFDKNWQEIKSGKCK